MRLPWPIGDLLKGTTRLTGVRASLSPMAAGDGWSLFTVDTPTDPVAAAAQQHDTSPITLKTSTEGVSSLPLPLQHALCVFEQLCMVVRL
jgi:hypothetical protein